MGTYTRFLFDARLKKDTPDSVVEYLRSFKDNANDYPGIPEGYEYHRFFAASHPQRILSASYAKGLFPDSEGVALTTNDDGSYRLAIESVFKNYSNEILNFLYWIRPWVEVTEVGPRGWYRTEFSLSRDLSVTTIAYHSDMWIHTPGIYIGIDPYEDAFSWDDYAPRPATADERDAYRWSI